MNAQFIDLIIQGWELEIEWQIRCRHGASLADPGFPGDLETYQSARKRVEADLKALRESTEGPFPLEQVVATHQLDATEEEILKLALMPLLDLSFRNRLARYNNNILFDYVDVDLALRLLFPDRRTDRLKARALFSDDSRLVRERLLSLTNPKEQRGSGTLGKELSPPARLADLILGRRSLDTTLGAVAALITPTVTLEQVLLPEGVREALLELTHQLCADTDPAPPFPSSSGLALGFSGPPGTGKTVAVHALAHALGRPVVSVDCAALHQSRRTEIDLVDTLFTEARVQGAVLVFDRCEALMDPGNPRLAAIFDQLAHFGGIAVLVTSQPDGLDPAVERHVAWQHSFDMPDVELRRGIWTVHAPQDVSLDKDVDLDDLATRFEITGGQISNAWVVAVCRARVEGGAGAAVSQEMLMEAAYAQIRARMEDYSIRSNVELTLDDLVLPDNEMTLIEEVLEACRNRVFVMSKWGFGKRLVTGKGICVLFKGEPGTGKTLCAEILAAELGMKLYQISIPKIVSKYIGETEKNIARIFSSARANHSMLLFDEADSLFTKRVSVESAVDRFSNMETNLLLQEIERFEGITILTTNLDKNIDDAFSRRIQFKIDFPFPEPEYRAQIWGKLIPPECPVDEDLDLEELGANFELSGGYIKNAVVRAAYRAAAGSQRISRDEILFAAEQECKNAGKLFRTPSDEDDW